jgi:probable HAF family extracellular repeat protein
MTFADRTLTRRRHAAAAVVAVTIVLLTVAGPAPAGARTPPAGREASRAMDIEGLGLGWHGRRPDGSRGEPGRPVVDGSAGFIYRNGRYHPLDTVGGLVTTHTTINDRGQTAGSYLRSDASELDTGGFVRSRSGRYARVDVAPGPSTIVYDIDNRGTTVGLYGNPQTGEGGAFRRRATGVVTPFEIPGGAFPAPIGINDRGAVVGTYTDGDGAGRGFLLERGRVTTMLPPGAADDPAVANVHPFDVNDRGQVVGCYADANGTYHGFRYDRDRRRYTRIDPPGGADVPWLATTCAMGINNRGHVVGQYVDEDSVLHGYLWRPGRGFRTIDLPPGASTVGPTGIRGSTAADINDRGDILVPGPSGFYKGRVAPIGG